MKSALTVDAAGRVVLPSEVRRRLSLHAGSRLRLAIVADRIELTPEPDAEPRYATTPSRRRVLAPAAAPFDAADATRAERDAQARRGGGHGTK